MKEWRIYDIPFLGLSEGEHRFSFEVSEAFFKLFEQSPIKDGTVEVKITFYKKSSFFIFNFEIDGTIVTKCDRCLNPLNQEIADDYTLFVKFENEDHVVEEDADVIYISRTETHLNLAQYIYEYVTLSIPAKKVHKIENCDPKMLEYLNKKEEKNKNISIDPRWDQLRNLKT